ncbi:ABC transporter permease [Fredinandcohnia quinoae]|uniref:ABC transporter permease subunit n=1 Tax=Fredinandcohnia quinoae TaxID=2918902 RepID=A0AAW5E8Y6_9BACI|nr:ABC transporter permease subunit [Fredinandcohnia sp. SECRCQ15]MCH1626472.1 ABC transporter permease subunit [Fredinandcohnia sp. SECRCQ15]
MNKNWFLIIGIAMVSFLLLIAFVGPHLPFVQEGLKVERLRFPPDGSILKAPLAPSGEFPFGTDYEGRNLISVLIAGTKDTLKIIIGIVVIRYAIAIPLGLLATRKNNIFSWLVTTWNNVFSSIPVIFSALLILCVPALVMNENRLEWSILFLALIEVGKVSHVIREETQRIARKPYIEAGITVGVSPLRLALGNILPNTYPSIMVNFFIDIGRTALLIAQLGIFSVFLSQKFVQLNYGSGEMINESFNWPTLLGQARRDVLSAIWIPFYTCIAITFTIFTFNILGEGLRRFFEKKTT